jgi:signal transduction histidine kinase
MTPLKVNRVLEGVFSLLGDHLLFQNIDLRLEPDPHLPLILGDKNRLEQVFINLLMNSGEAMKGEGRLTVRTSAVPEKGQVRLSFEDSGPGIPATYLHRLFDPFFTSKEVGQGVGLGLSISYGIIQKHLGRIYVERTGPDGTTFVIELPIYSGGIEKSKARRP